MTDSPKDEEIKEAPATETPATSEATAQNPAAVTDEERQTRQWAMLLHFSVLASWVVPLAGIVVPILIWQLKKDELPGIVPHAHVVLNWIVTSIVYGIVCFILLFIVIGVFGFLLLGLATLLFSIYGGIKANEGELWEYPGTIIKLFD